MGEFKRMPFWNFSESTSFILFTNKFSCGIDSSTSFGRSKDTSGCFPSVSSGSGYI